MDEPIELSAIRDFLHAQSEKNSSIWHLASLTMKSMKGMPENLEAEATITGIQEIAGSVSWDMVQFLERLDSQIEQETLLKKADTH